MTRMVKVSLMLSLLLIVLATLCACGPDAPSVGGTEPSFTDPTSTSKPIEECSDHNFPENSNACSICGLDCYPSTLHFTLSDAGDSYIVSDIGPCDATMIVIPETYKGLPVTEIGEGAFRGSFSGDRLYCNNITEVRLPASIKKIGANAFDGCTSLKKIVIPEGVVEICYRTFYRCHELASVTLPRTLTVIGASAFYQCFSLKTVDIPDGVTVIGKRAFQSCNAITELVLPNSVTSIGEGLVSNCSALETIQVSCEITEIPYVFAHGCSKLKTVDLGGNVRTIGDRAFEECQELQSIDLGNKLESIGEDVFSRCKSLHTITLPKTLKHIGKGAFRQSSLRTIELPDSIESINETSVFSGCDQLEYNEYQGLGYVGSQQNPYLVLVCRLDTTIKDVVTHKNTRFIQAAAIQDAEVRSLTLGKNVEQFPIESILNMRDGKRYSGRIIKVDASPENKNFHVAGNCLIDTAGKKLLLAFDNPVIPDDGSVTVIGGKAISHLSDVTEIVIPDAVEKIEANAFKYCENLQCLVIGTGVKEIAHDILIDSDWVSVFYKGSAEDWELMKIGGNVVLLNAPRYYYSETAPSGQGSFWHYVDGKPTPWPVSLPTTE